MKGVLKLVVKLPLLLVVTTAGVVVTVILSKVMAMVLLALKPLPVIVTAVPITPELGSMVIEWVVVKLAVSMLALASCTFMVWVPPELSGTVKVAPVKPPTVLVTVVATSSVSK